MSPAERTLASARDIARALGDHERAERYQHELQLARVAAHLTQLRNAERQLADEHDSLYDRGRETALSHALRILHAETGHGEPVTGASHLDHDPTTMPLASNAERDQRDDTADTHPGRAT